MDHFLSNTKIDPRFQIKFQTEFSSAYYKSGKHRVRCFPKCCDTGHILRGFCGEVVIAELNLRSDIDVESLLLVGEVFCVNNSGSSCYSRFTPDLEVNETDLRQRCYNDEDSLCLAQISIQQDNKSCQIQSGYNNYIVSFRKKPWQFNPTLRMSHSKKLSFIFSVTVFRSTTISTLYSPPADDAFKLTNKPILQYMGIQTSKAFKLHLPNCIDSSAIAKSKDAKIQKTISPKCNNNERRSKKKEEIFESITETKMVDNTSTPPRKRIRNDNHHPKSIKSPQNECSIARNKNKNKLPNSAIKQFSEFDDIEKSHLHFSSRKHHAKVFVEDSVTTIIDIENGNEQTFVGFANNTISINYYDQELIFQSPPLCLSTVFDDDDTDIEAFQKNHTLDSILCFEKKREYFNRVDTQFDKRNSIFELFPDYNISNIQSPFYFDSYN